ncbi:MAG: ABC transporter ATP-binding protein [Planctomycetota bacterium]|jgi:putative ABC transport system ATP-binding protein
MAVLQVRDLKKSYVSPDGATAPIIDIAAFAMEPGEQVALEGESGSGKTTFLHLISGILQADSGSVLVADEEITGLDEAARDRARAMHLGYVFQTFNLLDAYSALENVLLGMMFGPGADKARAQSLLERVGLADRLHYRPKQLSVGQQQRVAVARALANHPRLVLADEPTGNLDRARSMEALALIREVCRENEAALLLVSHDPAVLETFERRERLAELNRAGKPA